MTEEGRWEYWLESLYSQRNKMLHVVEVGKNLVEVEKHEEVEVKNKKWFEGSAVKVELEVAIK